MLIGLGFFGILIGFASGFFGIGGGTILVPSLMYFGYDIKTAIGISVLQMIFSSIFGSYINYRCSMLHLGNGLFLGAGAFVGASLSGPIVSFLPRIALLSIFATMLALSIYKFFTAPIVPTGVPNHSKPLLLVVGALIGMIAISVGTGGAIFLTPILVGFLHWEMKQAVSTGQFFVIFGSISGFVSLSMSGHVDYTAGLAVGIGSLLGVYFGTKRSHIVDKKVHKKLLLALYVILLLLTLNKIFS